MSRGFLVVGFARRRQSPARRMATDCPRRRAEALPIILRSWFFQRQMNPEQTVLLLRPHFFYIDFTGQAHFAFERAVIDFHRDHLQSGIFLATRPRHVAHTTDRYPP